jgi:hypothetical protein
MSNTQLTPAEGYDTKNIIVAEPKVGEVQANPSKEAQSKGKEAPAVNYLRIAVSTRNPDGTVGDLVLPTEELFSFGVGENTSQETGQVTGHTMSLCLWSRDRTSGKYTPTKAQLAWSTTYLNIIAKIKSVMIEYHAKGMLGDGAWRFASSDEDAEENGGMTAAVFRGNLSSLNNLYWGKGKKSAKLIEEGVYENGPTLYAKIIESKKKGKVLSQFYDYAGNELDPFKTLVGVYYNTFSAIKIESVYVGAKISLQVKLTEANCKLFESGVPKLLSRPKVENAQLLVGGADCMGTAPAVPGAITQLHKPPSETGDIDDQGSLNGDDTPPVVAARPAPRRRPAARAVPATK